MKSQNKGVLYLAIGEDYLALALKSISYLRATTYAGSIRLVTNCDCVEISNHLNIEIIFVAVDDESIFNSRYFKTQINQYAYTETLFLDADTLPIAPIDDIWEFLNESDLAFALDLHPNVGHVIQNSINDPERRQLEYQLMQDLELTNEQYFNSGVMLFKKNELIESFFSSWHTEWLKFRNEDQLALVRALKMVDGKISTLPSMWNQRPKKFQSLTDAKANDIKILHFLSRQRTLLQTFLNTNTA